MNDDELPIFRPRFGRRVRADDRGLRVALLSRLSARVRRGGLRKAGRGHVDARPSTARSRRVVVKARYIKMTEHGAAAAALHLRYIQRDGVERDGSPGVLYGPEGPVPAERFEQPRPGEKHQFRFIVSPEDAAELDLTDYVQRLMRKVEKDIGQPLEWAAVNHWNTEHPHAHVVVRGVDRRGREVRFAREYIGRTFRERAQEIATRELGERSPEEIARGRQREVIQERWTSLDQQIERRATDGRITRAALEGTPRAASAPLPLLARLRHLEKLRLAEQISPGTWTLSPGWKERLRDLGERNDIQKQMHAAVRGDPSRYRNVRPGEALGPGLPTGRANESVFGRIRAKALDDEMRGTFCAIVESADGTAYRVPVDPRTAANCRIGDFVTLSTSPRTRARSEDVVLEAMARAAGGVCALRPDDPARADLERRLRQLEAIGLARRDPSGGFRLVTDLPSALARLDHERPNYRLFVRPDGRSLAEQIRTRGPVWLDHIDPECLAPYGLGTELAAPLAARAEALRAFGVDPADPRKLAKLRELERCSVGERAAARERLPFSPWTPSRFQGRVAAADIPNYAVVVGQRELVVVPMTGELRAHVGRTVDVERDAAGKLRVQQARGR